MARLIDDLLDVSRIVQGKVGWSSRSGWTLATLIERSAESSLPSSTSRKQQLALRRCRAEPVELDGDSVRLAQVLSQPDQQRRPSSSPSGGRIELRADVRAGHGARSACATTAPASIRSSCRASSICSPRPTSRSTARRAAWASA